MDIDSENDRSPKLCALININGKYPKQPHSTTTTLFLLRPTNVDYGKRRNNYINSKTDP